MSTDETTDLDIFLSDLKRKTKKFWDQKREEIDERRQQSQENYKNWINKSFLGTNEEKEVDGSKLSAHVDEFFQRIQDRHDQNLKLDGGGRPNAADEIAKYGKLDIKQGFDESDSEEKQGTRDGSDEDSNHDSNVDSLVEGFNLDSIPENNLGNNLDLDSNVESGFGSELDLFSDVESGFGSEVDLFSDAESGFDSEVDLFSDAESGFGSEVDLFSDAESGSGSEVDLFSDAESGSGNESNIVYNQATME